ncbi:MAG: Mpo1-like protein [Opitutaceae bacterium]
MPKKTADQWFAEYGESHQNHANELIHWICVPLIFFSVMGFIWEIPTPAAWETSLPWFNWSIVAIVVLTLFYAWIALLLAPGMLIFMTVCQSIDLRIEMWSPWPVWKISLILFVVAWIGQFIGHKLEGRRPSFLQDILFLLIGPAWLLSKIYRKVGLKY